MFSEANGWHAQHERDVCVAYDQEHRAQGFQQASLATAAVALTVCKTLVACGCDSFPDRSCS